MNNLEHRIERLEKQTSDTEDKPWLIIVYDDTGKPSEAALEVAKAEYQREHPDYQGQDFKIIWVTSEECKKNCLRVMAGERTE